MLNTTGRWSSVHSFEILPLYVLSISLLSFLSRLSSRSSRQCYSTLFPIFPHNSVRDIGLRENKVFKVLKCMFPCCDTRRDLFMEEKHYWLNLVTSRKLPSANRCFHPCAAYAKNSLFRAELLRRKTPSLPI